MHYVAVVESYEDSAPPLILAPSKIWQWGSASQSAYMYTGVFHAEVEF